jgi:hypothetical protein
MGDAVLVDDTVVATVTLEKELYSPVLLRSAQGAWQAFTQLPAWIGPGVGARLIDVWDGLLTIRYFSGEGQVGLIYSSGQFQEVGALPLTVPEAGDMIVSTLMGATPYLFSTRYRVSLWGEGDEWTRYGEITPFRIEGDAMARADWAPPEAEGIVQVGFADDGNGVSVMLGTRLAPEVDESDIVGWRFSGDQIEPVTGFAEPRAQLLGRVVYADGLWVGVGSERATLAASQHSSGVVWASVDGLEWVRLDGEFDIDPDRDSRLSGACLLPDESLVVTGSVVTATSTSAIGFRWDGVQWYDVDLTGLGAGVTTVSNCLHSAGRTYLQGTQDGFLRAWVTTDGIDYSPIEMGERDQIFGIMAVEGGYVAAGSIYIDDNYRGVIWVSTNGIDWQSVRLPVDASATSNLLLEWGSRLLVPYSSTTAGDGVLVLNNLADFLQ